MQLRLWEKLGIFEKKMRLDLVETLQNINLNAYDELVAKLVGTWLDFLTKINFSFQKLIIYLFKMFLDVK